MKKVLILTLSVVGVSLLAQFSNPVSKKAFMKHADKMVEAQKQFAMKEIERLQERLDYLKTIQQTKQTKTEMRKIGNEINQLKYEAGLGGVDPRAVRTR